MAGGTLKKHPTSGALLLNPLRQLQRCTCCGECEYAIRAEPCWQELNEDCETLIPPLWFCVESKCFGGSQTLGQIKTPVTFLYTAPGDVERCWQTVPSSITLVSKLDPEIVEDLITDTALECVEEGCDAGACGDPESTCDCLCRSLTGDSPPVTDCCMSRLDADGRAPWTFTYRRTITRTVQNESRNGGPAGTSCVDDDCKENRECLFDFREWEIDPDELSLSYDPIDEQGCVKEVPIRFRNPTSLLGFIPGNPLAFPCCTEPDGGSMTWSAAGTLSVSPPSTIPLEVTVDESDVINEGGCVGKTIVTTTREGDCTFFREETISEVWTYSMEGGQCVCQQYQREVDLVEYEFTPATDEMTLRLCAQCAVAEALPP